MSKSFPHWMGKGVWLTATSLILLVVGFSSDATAEWASGQRLNSSANIDGFKGNQGIRTNPSTVNGVGFVHPNQIDIGSLGGGFVAVGTYNGRGTTGGSPDCPNDYDARWSIYTDGIIGGVYWCNKESDDAFGIGANPAFVIEWGWCPSVSANRWLLYMGGTLWRCKDAPQESGIAAVSGLETTPTTVTADYNIDAKYVNLKRNQTGSSTWISLNQNDPDADPNYLFTPVDSETFNVYLAPLD